MRLFVIICLSLALVSCGCKTKKVAPVIVTKDTVSIVKVMKTIIDTKVAADTAKKTTTTSKKVVTTKK